MTARLLGSEAPRIYTAARRELTPETSHGWACIAFAEDVLEMTLLPWQRWLFIHALELLPSGLYRFRTVVVLVARQNGKTLVMLILALWHLYALCSRTVIGTAQDLANAEKAWAEAVEMARGEPELAELIDKVNLGHPKSMRIRIDEDRVTEYRVASASRRGARGFSGDLVLLDELREHSSWDSWSAATKTTLARPRAQVWAFSNAGDAMSVVLRYLRAIAHRSLGWPDGDADADVLADTDEDFTAWEGELADAGAALGLFEWSAPPTSHRGDPEGWVHANPSLNHTELVENCITERAIAAALRTDPPHVFDVEVLCRWLTAAASGPFPEGSWNETCDNAAGFAPESRRVIAVDMSWSRNRTYIARAAYSGTGMPVADIAADRAGSDWVLPWLVDHRDKYDAIVLQAKGAPVSSLTAEIDDAHNRFAELAGTPLPLLKLAGPDLGAATGMVYDRLETRRIAHLAHPALDMAATSAVPKVLPSGAWLIDRMKSPSDTAPLVAWIAAIWGLVAGGQPRRSVYESDDVMFL